MCVAVEVSSGVTMVEDIVRLADTSLNQKV